MVKYYDKNNKRRKKSFSTRDLRKAKIRFNYFCEDLKNGIIAELGDHTLKKFLDSKIEEYELDRSEDFIRLARRVSKYLMDFFGETKIIDEITRKDAKKFRDYRYELGFCGNAIHKRQISTKTINNDIQMAKSIFESAVDIEEIEENPFKFVKNLTYIQKDVDAFKEEEVICILENAPKLYRNI